MDALSIVEDEVALDGLDGITIPSLWIRLEGRKPRFPLKLDLHTKEFIWRALVGNCDLSFYELPRERDDVLLYDRFADIDPETGIETREALNDQQQRTEIYPAHVIVKDKNGVQGSCALYKDRKDVTNVVRSSVSCTALLGLEEAFKRFGRRLVAVASQEVRFRALIGPERDPDLDLADNTYCILERVGRARWQGEVQSELEISLRFDAKKLFYLRKSLVKNGLITMQTYVIRMHNGQQRHSILLLLDRFHVNRRTKYDILMESMSNILAETPGRFATAVSLREQLKVNERTFRLLQQYMQSANLVKIINAPAEDSRPSAGPCATKRVSKVTTRCFQLIKPFVRKDLILEADDDENDDENGAGTSAVDLSSKGRIMERDLLMQAYHLVLSVGTRGISQRAIGSRMHINKLEARMICKTLDSSGMIKAFMEDEGKQRVTKYISHKCESMSDHLLQFARERNKLLCSSAITQNKLQIPKTPSSAVGSKSKGKHKTTVEKQEVSNMSPEVSLAQNESLNVVSHAGGDSITVEKIPKQVQCAGRSKKAQASRIQQPHETCRLLKRKNMIVETVQNLKIIEGIGTLKKMIYDEEKTHGMTTKVCKKTILRTVHSLSREGLVKIFTTTVVRDGINKKVDFVVDPSIQPDDELVKSAIKNIHLQTSSSNSITHLQQGQEKDKEQGHELRMSADKPVDFKSTTVKGMSRAWGYQPKMQRLRVIHTFLWYLLHGHPLQQSFSQSLTARTASNAGATQTSFCEQPEPSNPSISGNEPNVNSAHNSPDAAGQTTSSEDLTSHTGYRWDAGSPHLVGMSEGTTAQPDETPPHPNLRVYVDEISWKRFIPPVPIHKEFGNGWGLIEDVLLCLPLSVFMQVVQINYMLDGLETYLKDPVKQHCLVRYLPGTLKSQLLHKQKYVFSFHEHLQRLAYMGLLQFGPVETFQEKQKAFVYLMTTSTIVDTTSSEPHYRLVKEPPDKPFERRHYTFTTVKDVESYWFDLMCVSLNTPLGVNRAKRGIVGPTLTQDRDNLQRLAYLLKGTREVCDDGSIPGDGRGAGGLDSCFFAHRKSNWAWTIPERVEEAESPASMDQQVAGGRKRKRTTPKKAVVQPPCKKAKELKTFSPTDEETEHLASKKMTRQRFIWSIQEDSLMMLCSVASHLLNSMLTRPFVPYGVVRALLYAEFEIAEDKTPVFVGQHMRTILKNPQTLLNYKVCLAEVYQDTLLVELLQDKKPTNPDDPEDCAAAFSEFTRLLRLKFSSGMSNNIVVPNTKKELFSRFKVYTIDEGKGLCLEDSISCTDDIHTIVLNNLMHSTMLSNSQMKLTRSFQTFNIYGKYCQEVLHQVFIQYRKKGVVSRRRVSDTSGPKQNRALPILPMSYQMSQTYFRSFQWRFPATLCTDAFQFIRTVNGSGAVDGGPFIAFYNETERRYGLGGRGKESGEVCPEEKEDESGRKENKCDKEKNVRPMTVDSSTEDHMGDHTNPEEQTQSVASSSPAAQATEEPQDFSSMVQFSLDSPGGACAALLSLMTLGLVSVHVSIPQQVVLVDSNLVDNDVAKSMRTLDEDDDEDNNEAEKLHLKSHQASHTKYLMMRGCCSPGIAQFHNLSANDSIVVESCLISVQMRDTPAHRIFNLELSPPLDFFKCGPSLLPSILTRSFQPSLEAPSTEECDVRLIQQYGYTAQDVQACAEIQRSLDGAGENGLSKQDLYQALKHLAETQPGSTRNLEQYVHELQEQGHVLQVGGFGPRWVLMRHAGPWILTSKSGPRPQFHTTQEEKDPFWGSPRNIFARKRCREDCDKQELPPGKRVAVDVERRQEAGGFPGRTTDRVKESEEQERQGEGKKSTDIAPTEMEPGKKDIRGNSVTWEQRDGRIGTKESGNAGSPSPPPSSSPADNDDGDDVGFISRPWRLADGGLNGLACKGMLEALLFHIMSRPGLTRQALVEHYKDVLQPMAISDLLQALIELGCVKKKALVKAPKVSLFSRPGHQTVCSADMRTEEARVVFYEPTISCCLRLAQVFPNEANWNYYTQV